MTHHFGVLIPSTNTTVEIEHNRLLPPTSGDTGRLLTSGSGPFSPSKDEDTTIRRAFGTAKVEVISLAQTSASLFSKTTTATSPSGSAKPPVSLQSIECVR